MSRLLGGRKPRYQPVSHQDPDPETVSPWPGRQLACLCVHAYTDTNEKPTMTLLSSKIEPTPPKSPWDRWLLAFHCSYFHNASPPPFNPGGEDGDGEGRGRAGRAPPPFR